MDAQAAAKWFPFVATLFFFIWFSNILGYIPLPTNDHETIDIFGFAFPAFALYAATANLSIPLVLTLTVFVIYQVEGIRRHGFVKYLKGWLPAGVSGAAAVPIFIIEVISQFVRIISLSVRLFANILAGPSADPFHGRRARGAARHHRSRLDHAAPGGRVLHASRWGWWPPCRPSSSPRSRLSTSARQAPEDTKEDPWTLQCCSQSPRRPTQRTA